MKFSNAAKLKAAVKKIAADSGVTAQGVLQKYVLERFLCRLAASEYRDNFILKGGFLTSSLVGVANRTTMDIDATMTGIGVNPSTLKDVLLSICLVDLQDGFSFSFDRIESIREKDSYPGLRAYLQASFSPMTVPFFIDVTTGSMTEITNCCRTIWKPYWQKNWTRFFPEVF